MSRRAESRAVASYRVPLVWDWQLLSAMSVARPLFARAAAQEPGGPGPAADRLIFSAFNVDQAPIEITQNKMDLYLYGLKAAGAEDLAGAQDVRVIQAPASTLSLILNPAPAREG